MQCISTRIATFSVCAALLVGAVAAAQQEPAVPASPPTGEREVRKVSDHVWVIDGSKSRALFPNVGIIVGTRATLVVDTGIGTPNGEIVMREVKRLSSNPSLYLTYTHFHTEHGRAHGKVQRRITGGQEAVTGRESPAAEYPL